MQCAARATSHLRQLERGQQNAATLAILTPTATTTPARRRRGTTTATAVSLVAEQQPRALRKGRPTRTRPPPPLTRRPALRAPHSPLSTLHWPLATHPEVHRRPPHSVRAEKATSNKQQAEKATSRRQKARSGTLKAESNKCQPAETDTEKQLRLRLRARTRELEIKRTRLSVHKSGPPNRPFPLPFRPVGHSRRPLGLSSEADSLARSSKRQREAAKTEAHTHTTQVSRRAPS